MAVIRAFDSLRSHLLLLLLLLLSFIFTTVSVHFTVLASAEKPLEATSNPYLESKGTKPAWCVANDNAKDSDLQKALDWTCQQVGADCGPIQPGGPCYNPNNFQNMVSYAFNDYFLKHGKKRQSCNFGNTADLSALDPSHDNCVFPSSRRFGGTPQTGPGAEGVNGCLAVGGWSWTLIIRPLLFTSTLAFLL